MKKILALILTLIMVMLCLAACTVESQNNGNDNDNDGGEETKEKLIVGYTDYAPMNYMEDGKLVGFDTELAEAVAEKLDMDIEFVEINWGKKYLELDSGAINCIWNGFTSNCADDDGVQRSAKVDFSVAYMNNAQCVVVKASEIDNFTSTDDLADKLGAAEDGSAGAGKVAEYVESEENYIAKDAQTDALTEVLAGSANFAIVDRTMAEAMVGNGDFATLAIAEDIVIENELYSIGFKKDSELTAKVNQAIKELAEDGTMMELAKKYKLENYVIVDFD